MRYTILRPHEPTDPRFCDFDSLLAMRDALPPVSDTDVEEDAVDEVRRLFPDALAMPVGVRVGAGQIVLLGLVNALKRIDESGRIPFVLFVQAIPETPRDKQRIRDGLQFHRTMWRPPVLRPPTPDSSQDFDVHVRATDLDAFAIVPLRVFRRLDNGKTVLYAEVGGIELSIEFQEPALLVKTP
jgi:hypothetical protein